MSTKQIQAKTDTSWKFRYGTIYFYSFIMVGNIIIALGPLIPVKAKAGGQLETDYSIVFTCRGIGYMLGSLVVTKLQRKYGSHQLMTLTSLVIAAVGFLNIGETSIFMNCIHWSIVGASCSFIELLTQVSITYVYLNDDVNINAWLQALHFGFGVGAFVAPLLITVLGDNTMGLLGIMALLNALLAYRQASPKIQKQEEQQEKEPKSLKKEAPQSLVIALCTYSYLNVGFQLGYGGWIPTFCTLMGITDEKSAGVSASIFWVAMTVGRLIAIPMATRFKAFYQLRVLAYFNFIVILFSVFLMLSYHFKLLIYLGPAITGLGVSAVYPLLMSTPGSFGYGLTPSITSYFIISGAIGEATVPVILGISISIFGPRMMFYVLFILIIGTLIMFCKVSQYNTIAEEEQKSSLQVELIQK